MKKLAKRLRSILCLVLALIMVVPANTAYAFSWEDFKEITDYVTGKILDNAEEINSFIETIELEDVSEYFELLADSKALVEENFAFIMQECKSQKELLEDALYTVEEFDWLSWGRDMVKASGEAAEEQPIQPVKVALIDSGVNYSSDIDVVERKNFIPGHEEISILYEDVSGHGTNIAGVIAAKDNEEGITGVNPNVELYSAKVLDAGNSAPISRVVEGIEWAIEKGVNIINISFTTDTNSQELYDVIKKAYDAGILIVAAAGNDGYVAYPAAYPEVIAVGSINSEGEISAFSPSGATVELVAPGELITSTDVFNTMSTNSGTSYAAPYVTAIASLLWEKDLACSSNFIRCVLDSSANLYGAVESYGYGLVDYQFAEAVYELLKPVAKDSEAFEALMKYAVQICGIYNPTSVPVVSAPDDLVEGAWYATSTDANGNITENSKYAHRNSASGFTLATENAKALLLAGCVLPDVTSIGLANMYLNPYFHGYMHYDATGRDSGVHTEANYLAGAIYLSYVAEAMLFGQEYMETSNNIKSGSYDLTGMINSTYIDSVQEITWEMAEFQIEYYGTGSKMPDEYNAEFSGTAEEKALVIYGLALHSIMDIFAHSSVELGTNRLLKHDDVIAYGMKMDEADHIYKIRQRYEAAVRVIERAMRQICVIPENSLTSTVDPSCYSHLDLSVFDYSRFTYLKGFKLANFAKYAHAVCDDVLFEADNDYILFFDEISTDVWN